MKCLYGFLSIALTVTLSSASGISCYSCASAALKGAPGFVHNPLKYTDDCKKEPAGAGIPMSTDCPNDCITEFLNITIQGKPYHFIIRGCLNRLFGIPTKIPDQCITEKLPPPQIGVAKVCFCTQDKCNTRTSQENTKDAARAVKFLASRGTELLINAKIY